jgi:hypothetical protein
MDMKRGVCISVGVFWILIVNVAFSQNKLLNNPLFAQFQNPGNAARPRVWWHWMNGNVTLDGIQKDLLWMHQSGIGGFHQFDAGLSTPLIVPARLTFMSPEWKKAVGFAAKLADSLQLEMAIAGSPGWSVTGGPWVKAKDGMKKLVWRELRVNSGITSTIVLPTPYTQSGPFQNIPIEEDVTAFSTITAAPPEYYEDIAVLAYRLPEGDISADELKPNVTSSGGHFTLAQLTDGNLTNTSLLPADSVTGYAWVQFEFPTHQTIKALSITGTGLREQWGVVPLEATRRIDVSNDGVDFKPVCALVPGGVAQQTIAIPATTARYFRVIFNNPKPSQYVELAGDIGLPAKPSYGTELAELVLHPLTRVNHVEEKAGFASTYDVEKFPTPSSTDGVPAGEVIDLTTKLKPDGTLNWTPPAGELGARFGLPAQWKIVRFGYSLTGKKNHPASPEATGLEVDKMDARAVNDYFETYLNQYKEATGGLMGKRGLQYLVTDSYESGQETWTPNMAAEFQARRGYTLLPWMPVLIGQVINSAQASDQFLWDWRKTIAELIAENHYDQLTTILSRYGMKRYAESHENGRLYIVDGMDVKRSAAVPMAAMWEPSGWGSTTTMAQADIRESASVAHIYGQNLVAAESLTAFGPGGHAWSYCPENLKPTADLELANGLNRFVIHTSVHQPVDDKIPGLGLFVFGQWFNRHETWASYAKSWTDYLARSSFLLQQGKFVADVVYYYGEDNNITGLFGAKLPDVPKGYNYDFINPHALLNLLSVKDGRLVTPSGMSYRVLHLDSNARKMSLPVLRKIAWLVKAGAIISGMKPEFLASRTDNAEEFKQLVREIWESGNNHVHTGKTLQQVLSASRIQPDFEVNKKQYDTELLYVHRRLTGSDLYWVNNRKDRTETVEVNFRVSGRIPTIWHPETGKTEAVSYQSVNGRTHVTLNLTPNDAVFVVFAAPASKALVVRPPVTETDIVTADGLWNVTFQANRGAPAQALFDKLISYTDHPDAEIRYFSGTASYSKTIRVPTNAIASGTQLWLDLGEVKNIAEVIVNGKPLGVVWKKPFRLDITSALKAGDNNVIVNVTNLWVNRLIGDQQPDTKQKITYTTLPFYKATSPLLPSGLLGPVKIIATK